MDIVKIDYVKNTIKKLNTIVEDIDNLSQDCEQMLFEFEKDCNRHKYFNIDSFFKDERALAIELYECNKQAELFKAYCEWCEEHEVNALTEPEFLKDLESTAKHYTCNSPIDKELSAPFVHSQFCAFISGCIDKGNTIAETQAKAKNYCLKLYPNANEMLQNIFASYASVYQNSYFEKQGFENAIREEILKNAR